MKEKKSKYPSMPIKGAPYDHQRSAFEFACRLFGLVDADNAGEHAEPKLRLRIGGDTDG